MTESLQTTATAGNEGAVTFADDRARALLAPVLGELTHPHPPRWRQVKQNVSRTVWYARIDGQGVYVKHFHPRSKIARLARAIGVSKARQEYRHARYLTDCGIATAKPLAVACRGPQEWVATREVAPATAADAWHDQQRRADTPEARRAVRQANLALARLLARMHRAGLLHGDLHGGNVLIRTDTDRPNPVLMDLHRVWRRRRLSRRARAANLAQLLHDRQDTTTRAQRLRFLREYLRASGAGGSLSGWAIQIEDFARRHTRDQYAGRDRRVRRTNKYFRRLRLGGGWRGHVVLASKWVPAGSQAAKETFTADQWRESLGTIEDLFDKSAGEVIKDSRSSLVIRRTLTLGSREVDVHIKRARRKKAWKVLLDCLRPSRAVRAFCQGHNLLTRGIDTALPLAALERRVGPCLFDSVLITETVDALECNQFLNHWLSYPLRRGVDLDAAQKRKLAQEVLRELGHVLQRLHDHNYAHRDMKASNLLIQWDGQGPARVTLVDLDGLRRKRWLTMRQRFQGLMRLNVSLLECPAVNHAGRLRMLLGYLRRPGMGRIRFKPYWRALEAWSDRKLHQQIRSRRRRQWALRRPRS